MLKKLILFFCLSLPCVALFYAIFPIRTQDYALYEQLLKSSDPEKHVETPLCHTATQKRNQVSKEIWIKSEKPLYCKIESGESELFLLNSEKGIAVVEKLKDVHCLIQEELYYEGQKPMQKLHFIKAKTASYSYTTQAFSAEDIELWSYNCEGHEAPKAISHLQAYMQGCATSLDCSLVKGHLKIQAENIYLEDTQQETKIFMNADKALYERDQICLKDNISIQHTSGCVTAKICTLQKDSLHGSKIPFPWISLKEDVCLKLATGGKLQCDQLFIDYTQMTSYLTSHSQLHYQDDLREIFANSAQIDFKEEEKNLKITRAQLKGEVSLRQQSELADSLQYAHADEVSYFPQDLKAALTGILKPVLFYDSAHKMELAAWKVYASKDVITKQMQVFGEGDVRFFFQPEELKKIKNPFKGK